MKKIIDFNCDMGESYGIWEFGKDEEMMEFITSANLACGYHAGDPNVMKRSVDLCKEKNIAVGAHVGLPDLMGFGRRKMDVNISELKNYIIYQVGALKEFLKISKLEMQHIKLHGALMMMAAESKEISRAVLEATADINENLIFYTMESTLTFDEAKKMGFNVAREFYVDRGCQPNGLLVFDYKLQDIGGNAKSASKRLMRVLEDKKVKANNGEDIDFECETFCVHSDTDIALEISKEVKKEIDNSEWKLSPVKNFL